MHADLEATHARPASSASGEARSRRSRLTRLVRWVVVAVGPGPARRWRARPDRPTPDHKGLVAVGRRIRVLPATPYPPCGGTMEKEVASVAAGR